MSWAVEEGEEPSEETWELIGWTWSGEVWEPTSWEESEGQLCPTDRFNFSSVVVRRTLP